MSRNRFAPTSLRPDTSSLCANATLIFPGNQRRSVTLITLKRWSRTMHGSFVLVAQAEKLRDLARRGIKRVAVSCPSFVADCLETLEEIGIRGRETFIRAGGEELDLIPSLNSDPTWVETVAKWIRDLGD